jgi:hypothetical protein
LIVEQVKALVSNQVDVGPISLLEFRKYKLNKGIKRGKHLTNPLKETSKDPVLGT